MDAVQVPATPTKIRTRAPSTRGLPRPSPRARRPPTPRTAGAELRPHVEAPSIFSAGQFGRYVATHFLADADLHGHRPAVHIHQRLSWALFTPVWRLISAFGSSRIASPAYQNWPTRRLHAPHPAPATVRARVRSLSRARGPEARGPPLFRSTPRHCQAPAILRDISGGTSYQAVRLVFRPYAQVRESICTSEPLRTSSGVSPGLILPRRSSQPFGSHAPRYASCPVLPLLPALAAPRLTLAPHVHSLVRVSRRAHPRPCAHGFRPNGFTPFHRTPVLLFFFPSRYFSPIGLPLVFSLRWYAPPFRLRSRAALLLPAGRARATGL